jgi:tripartite-type tricarboxylate transporter receptor subunit TctC
MGASTLATVAPAFAQAWPNRPVRLMVPFPPGGPTDSFARMYADALSRPLGQSEVVDNKSGAGGTVGAVEVKNAAPDGYTLLFGTASTPALYNLIQNKPQFDALTDFEYVAVLGGAPVVFVVSTTMPRTLKNVVIATKHSPGKSNYGSLGNGTLLHVSAERLKKVTGANIAHLPYRGSAPAMKDLLGGNIEMPVHTLGTALPQHQADRVRIVAVAADKRVARGPDIPTVAESADLDLAFVSILWNVVTAPRGTPPQVISRLQGATKRVMTAPALLSKLGRQAMFVDLHIEAAAVTYVKAERARLAPVVDSLVDLKQG